MLVMQQQQQHHHSQYGEAADWLDEVPANLRQAVKERFQQDQLVFQPPGTDQLSMISTRSGMTSIAYLWLGWSEGHRMKLSASKNFFLHFFNLSPLPQHTHRHCCGE